MDSLAYIMTFGRDLSALEMSIFIGINLGFLVANVLAVRSTSARLGLFGRVVNLQTRKRLALSLLRTQILLSLGLMMANLLFVGVICRHS